MITIAPLLTALIDAVAAALAEEGDEAYAAVYADLAAVLGEIGADHVVEAVLARRHRPITRPQQPHGTDER